ncbi:PilZ domain-containing protein [Cohnella sp. REN36]|uniref:PilZ domain-containing protein n=1 Tax=Cohnella sp. REN36 TaxID=2887347 RepID=UPI001D137BAC|nr:PilZ domain-containing protein [Cohnella sp. REN36]
MGGAIGGGNETAAAAEPAVAGADPVGPERRRQTRISLDVPIMMSIYQWEQAGAFAGQSVEGTLRDVSEDGLQISSTLPLEKDMFVVLHFKQETGLPPMTARIIRIERSNNQFQYGCMLSGLALYQRLQLKEYIERHAGD